jgi:hypothetical protein
MCDVISKVKRCTKKNIIEHLIKIFYACKFSEKNALKFFQNSTNYEKGFFCLL